MAEKDLTGEDSPFTEYERFVRQSRFIAKVTRHNIGAIAEFIGGGVDYSGEEPVLIDTQGHGASWRVSVGWTVAYDGKQLSNENGMFAEPSNGWNPVEAKPEELDRAAEAEEG